MAKKKKKGLTGVQKLCVILVILCIAQGIFYYVFKPEPPKTIREAINESIAKQENLSPERMVQLRIQAAVNDHMLNHDGKAPSNLDELVPKYFDRVPLNPRTSKPFLYQIIDNKPFVGELKRAIEQAGGSGKKGTPAVDADQEELLIAALDKKDGEAQFIYDPTGKRDPFRPFNFAPVQEMRDGATPLEKYDIGQLKLTAVLEGFDIPTAIIENQAGRGFTVRPGMKIGFNGGEIVEIRPDRILILETSVDFTGQEKTKTIELKLRTKDQEEKMEEFKNIVP